MPLTFTLLRLGLRGRQRVGDERNSVPLMGIPLRWETA